MTLVAAALLYLVFGAVVWTIFIRARPAGGPDAFIDWFDRIFGVRHHRGIALPRFSRSVLMSCLSLVLLAVWWALNKEPLSRALRFGGGTFVATRQLETLLVVYGGATVVTNWIPDYLSLVQSRWVIGRMAATKSPLLRLPWIVVDACLTLAIAFGAIYLGARIVLPFVAGALSIEVGCFTAETFTIGSAWEIFRAGLSFESPPGTLNYDAASIYIYSTFVTSVWLWLHLGASFAAHVAAVLFPRARRVATSGVLGFGALVIFSVCFWSVHFGRAPHHDVRVVFDSANAVAGERMITAMRDEGLSVTTEGLTASVVVVIGERYEHGDVVKALEDQIACGARSTRTFQRVRPNVDRTALIIDWAKRAPVILARDQVRQCRRERGLSDLPACVDPGQRNVSP